MGIGDIIRPDEDVDIGHAFSGSIRCRRLTVLEGGSVTGSVVADRVDVHGSLNGVVDCEHFQARPSAFVRGTVFSPNNDTRDNDGQSADVLVLHSTKRQAIFDLASTRPSLNFEEVINAAIDEAVAERISPITSARPVEVAASIDEAPEVTSERDLGLLERLASKGLTSLVPADPESEELPGSLQSVQSSDRAGTSGRTPLPSLV
jgi:hypothetical protein